MQFCLATIGVCVFCALTSVGTLFIFRRKILFNNTIARMKKVVMKKKNIIILSCVCAVLLLVGIILMIIFLKPKAQVSPKQLDTPQVILIDDKATWTANDLADKFEISIDGGLSFLENTVTSKKLDDGQTLKIRAIGDGIHYRNSDWSNSVTYTKANTNYTITWKNGDTILKIDENVPYGAIPSYVGENPTKDATPQYTYTFSGWSPQISAVTESAIYQAQFSETVRTYTVTFYSEDGATILDTSTVEYGSDVTYSKSNPVKNATAGYTYNFEKWVTTQGGSIADDLKNVTYDRSVYASFKEIVRTVSVFIVSSNLNYGTVSASRLNDVPYGTSIVIDGNAIKINGQTVTAQENTATAQYTYTFSNWTAASTVGNDTIITANFNCVVNSYTVTWMNDNAILEVDENVDYGIMPVYNGEPPTKASDNENIYIFSGWSPIIASVTGDITYIAQFTNKANKHTVIFYDDDGTTELGRVVVRHGETTSYPNALPTKESTLQITYTFDKWVTVNGGDTEASFENILEDKSVYAKYTETARIYTVTFCDFDGTILSQTGVAYGNAATAPEDPQRDGFRFDCWDKSYNSITEDITVTAKYVQQFMVEFLDYDNSIIDTQLVDYNGNAIAPENPVRNNYRFTRWNTGFSNVVIDLKVKAEYVRQYKVNFLDYDGALLKEYIVDAGANVVPPGNPSLEGYEFVGWDKEYSNIRSDLSITALYKIKTYTVKFVMPDGTSIGEIQTVEHGFSAIAPDCPEFFLIGTGDETQAYGFTKWNKSFDVITHDIIIEAVYESVYTKPIIIIEFSHERNGNVNLYIFNHESVKLNAIEFLIDYSTNIGNISINSVTVNAASPLWVEDSNGTNNNQYVINNNENAFTFAWSDANGKQFNWCSKVLTFSFSTDGAVVGNETFVVNSCSAVVSDGDGKNLKKITPVVVYR